jgi:hypothetical protein
MLLNGFNRPLRLTLKPSRLLFYHLYFVHSLAILAIVFAALPDFYSAVLLLAVVLSILLQIKKHRQQSASIIEKWVYPGHGEWLQVLANHTVRWQQVKAYQLPGIFSVVVLCNKINNRHKHLLLVYDQMEKGMFRRLQVILSSRERYATVKEDNLA